MTPAAGSGPRPLDSSGGPGRVTSVTASPAPDPADAMACWREAWRIRRAHPRWAVLWISPAGQYQAFRRSRQHRGTVLTAATPDDLTAQIIAAEQAVQDHSHG
jgi:hypothetical protein